jgi:hypothetical protein
MAGLVLIAATPARGAPVCPAAYPGVLRVTGDDYGACPHGLADTPVGASLAAAHVTGLLAKGLGTVDTNVILTLGRAVCFRGRERRTR